MLKLTSDITLLGYQVKRCEKIQIKNNEWQIHVKYFYYLIHFQSHNKTLPLPVYAEKE